MTTTSSTTSTTTTPTTATTSQQAKANAGSSILTALGAGSGIDTATLVTNLVAASFSDKESTLQTKTDANTAKISSLGTLSGGIDSFASALQQLVAGGTLKSQPSTSDSSVVTATAQSGSSIGNLSAQIEVRQIATAQSMVSGYIPDTSSIGTGSLTLTTGTGAAARTFNIAIDSTNNSLSGLANAINATNTGTTPSGITASVVTDSNGARLVLKGGTGAANSFSLAPNSDADSDLTRFASPQNGGGMTVAQSAQDAIIRMDGVDTVHSSNTVTDLLPGVTLNLVSAKVGTTVSLGVTRPTDAISQAVNDYVSAYNTLLGEITTAIAPGSTDGTTSAGPLYGNSAIGQMKTMLQHITSTALTNDPSGPQTLAEIGVSTGLDGTLTVDSNKLSTALSTYPDAVEAMFNPGQRSDNPLIKITSAMGSTKPGTYTISGVTTGSPPHGTIGGQPGLPSSTDPNGLVAMSASTAPGLSIQVLGNVASATITVDAGLSGILQGIRDTLRASGGLLDSLSQSLTTEKSSLADAKTKLTDQENTYSSQLTTQFTAMQTAVASYKSIQSFMTQQIAQWSNKD
jgi:flagellar hook-associated protein 2